MPGCSDTIRNHYTVVFLCTAIACAAADILVNGTAAFEALLVYILLINVGFQGLLAGFMHWYGPSADMVAEKIGWAPKSPFQKEVAAADAAFGLLGILAFLVRDNFLVATVIGASVMLFLMGIGHVLDIQKRGNFSPYNAGSVLWFDLLVPVAMVLLLVLWKTGS